MGPVIFDKIKQLILLSVIQLSGGHSMCKYVVYSRPSLDLWEAVRKSLLGACPCLLFSREQAQILMLPYNIVLKLDPKPIWLDPLKVESPRLFTL